MAPASRRSSRLRRLLLPVCVGIGIGGLLLAIAALALFNPLGGGPADPGPPGNGNTPGPNLPPVLRFSLNATEVATSVPVLFDATASYDPDGRIVAHSWTVRKGTPQGGVLVTDDHATFSHSFSDDGIYFVFLRITDDRGASVISSEPEAKRLKITNRAPVTELVLDAAQPVPVDATVGFRAQNATDADGHVADYQWEFGDGAKGAGPAVSHAYQASGSYVVRLTVFDDDGASATRTLNVTVV